MIRAVLFDFGGVLTEGGKAGSIARVFAKIYGIDEPRIKLDPYREQYTRGEITDEMFFETMNRLHPGGDLATKEAFNEHADIFVKCEPVYRMAELLRQHNIRTAILSNVFSLSVEKLRADGFYEGFDPLILSCEEGSAKPDPEIYKRAAEKLDLPPHEIIFIDDQAKFLEPARKFGMQTVHAQSPQQIIADTIAILKAENNLELELSELQ
jgi:epoxide hydrolase-like predicted phosphatase